MWKDPIVEEIHRYREEYAARFNYDLHAICEDLRKKQKESGREAISLTPEPLAVVPAAPELPDS